MSIRPAAAAVAVALVALAGACGGGGGSGATTTSSPSSVEDSTSSSVDATTSTLAIDPALQELLLTAGDLPGFKEKDPPVSVNPTTEEDDDALNKCVADAPELQGVGDAPEIEGSTFVRGAEDAVEVSSSVSSGDAGGAETLLKAVLDGKLTECLEAGFQAGVGKDAPAGLEFTFKTTATKATVAGADQTVVLGSTIGATGPGVKLAFRLDIVLLRQEGTVVSIFYFGPSGLTSVAERQRFVAAVSKKLQGTSTSSSSTSSTSQSSSTTRKSTSTTRRSSTTSTTRRASTTSSSSSGSSSTSSSQP